MQPENIRQTAKPLEFSVGCMKKGDHTCNRCKKQIRVGNLFVTEIFNDKKQGVLRYRNDIVYHSHCFARIRLKLNWNESAKSLVGFDKLTKLAQDRLNDLIIM